MPVPTFPVAEEASRALVWQGRSCIGPLIALYRETDLERVHRQVVLVLGEIGPDQRTVEFFGELMASPDYGVRCSAVKALGRSGPSAVPPLLRAARDPKEHGNIRRDAIKALGVLGRAEDLEAVILEMLRQKEDQLIGAAAEAAGKLGVASALPDLTRIARSEEIDQNARYAAMRSVVQVAPREQAAALLMELMDEKHHNGVRGIAGSMLAQIDWREALPRCLDALEDGSWFIRATADDALCGFARKPEGVGYNSHAGRKEAWRREADKWREWFRKNP